MRSEHKIQLVMCSWTKREVSSFTEYSSAFSLIVNFSNESIVLFFPLSFHSDQSHSTGMKYFAQFERLQKEPRGSCVTVNNLASVGCTVSNWIQFGVETLALRQQTRLECCFRHCKLLISPICSTRFDRSGGWLWQSTAAETHSQLHTGILH